MTTVTIDEMQRDTRALIERAAAGETIVIMERDHAVAEMKPVETISVQERPYGLAKGQFVVPDDFDAPLAEDILRAFEGRND